MTTAAKLPLQRPQKLLSTFLSITRTGSCQIFLHTPMAQMSAHRLSSPTALARLDLISSGTFSFFIQSWTTIFHYFQDQTTRTLLFLRVALEIHQPICTQSHFPIHHIVFVRPRKWFHSEKKIAFLPLKKREKGWKVFLSVIFYEDKICLSRDHYWKSVSLDNGLGSKTRGSALSFMIKVFWANSTAHTGWTGTWPRTLIKAARRGVWRSEGTLSRV